MQDPEHFGTYARSTGRGGSSARFTQKDIKNKTFENSHINVAKEGLAKSDLVGYHGRTGTFSSPFAEKNYQKAFIKKAEKLELPPLKIKKASVNPDLHDQILNYKNDMCRRVAKAFAEEHPHLKKKIRVDHHNNYSCLMVSFSFVQKFDTPSEAEAWNKVIIAYLIAITNHTAEKKGVPLELVHRSGLGYHSPTVDTTGASFRINIGVVPKVYTDVLVESLANLVEVIKAAKKGKPKEYVIKSEGADFLTQMNKRIRCYKCKLPQWKEKHSIGDILSLPGDAKNQPIIYQIMRQRHYLDLLAQYVAKELDKEAPDYSLPLIKMLSLLDFGKTKSTKNVVSMAIENKMFKIDTRQWLDKENPEIKKDKPFWALVTDIFQSVDAADTFPENKVLLGFNAHLEKANKEFVLRAAMSKTKKIEDGVGSESECEGTYGKKSIYGKKLTVATGMRAINVAYYLARFFAEKYWGVDEYRTNSEHMYYEVDGIFKLSHRNSEELAIRNQRKKHIPILALCDLNHCDTTGKKKMSLKTFFKKQNDASMVPVIILDNTSATIKEVSDAIKVAFDYGMKVILLANSGLKHEQNGADNHHFGTVRIITLNEKRRDKLYEEAAVCLEEDEDMPAMLHKMRKAYKAQGHVPTNQSIFDQLESGE